MKEKPLRILDFDSEFRPIGFYGGDFVTKQPTVISWQFIRERSGVECYYIGASDRMSKMYEEEGEMLWAFKAAYDMADIVTAHYVRGFDLRNINGALLRMGIPTLGPKLTLCTKDDLVAVSGMSKSMENLSAMFDLRHQKKHMNTADWFEANTLQPEGIARAIDRCTSDVKEHIELFEYERDIEALGAPRLWDPGTTGKRSKYHA